MKEYFSHDYNARTDRKLTKLLMVKKLEGIGAYWCIVEMLYENDGILPTEYDRIAFELRTDNDLIKSVINDFELFIIEDGNFYSESVNSRLKIRTDRSDQARENVNKRWNKYKGNTDVIQTNEVGNTIKVKESKENKINNGFDLLIDGGWNNDLETYNGITANYPKLFKMKRPLLFKEHERLVKKWGLAKIKDTYRDMEGWAELLKKRDWAAGCADAWNTREAKK